MVIVNTTAYPPESVKDMAERFLSLPDLPEYMTRRGPYIASNLDDGIVTTSIYELDKSKLAEGLEFLANNIVRFYGVPGFTYKIKPCFDVEEAMPMLGMG
jgi:hypothetical protein